MSPEPNIVPTGSEEANEANRVLLKEVKKNKYLPSEVVTEMKKQGFNKFSLHYHTKLWKKLNAKNNENRYGVKISKEWYRHDSWVSVVLQHCEDSGILYK